jgi:hypothetical protein
VSLGSFGTPLSPLPPEKTHTKNKGVGAGFLDTLSITLVVSGLPFGSLLCLGKFRDDVVDCSCESAGQSVYGPRIGFLGHFGPFCCKTDGSITSSRVARSLYWIFRHVRVLRVTFIIYVVSSTKSDKAKIMIQVMKECSNKKV